MPDFQQWPFDQAPNVASITTRQVLKEGYPVLSVVHYSDDDSWAFTCGTISETSDIKVISMEEALALDPTLFGIADLPPGWVAKRVKVGGEWHKFKNKEM